MADTTAKTDPRLEENARKLVKEGAEQKAKSVEEANARLTVKPTPSQEENDLAKVGVPIEQHEDDGSGPDPHDPHAQQHKKQSEAGRKPGGGDYTTRSAQPQQPKPASSS